MDPNIQWLMQAGMPFLGHQLIYSYTLCQCQVLVCCECVLGELTVIRVMSLITRSLTTAAVAQWQLT